MKSLLTSMFENINHPPYLAGLAVLAVSLLLCGGNLHNLLCLLVTLSTIDKREGSTSSLARIGDSGGDTTNPAGDPPPGGGNPNP